MKSHNKSLIKMFRNNKPGPPSIWRRTIMIQPSETKNGYQKYGRGMTRYGPMF